MIDLKLFYMSEGEGYTQTMYILYLMNGTSFRLNDSSSHGRGSNIDDFRLAFFSQDSFSELFKSKMSKGQISSDTSVGFTIMSSQVHFAGCSHG